MHLRSCTDAHTHAHVQNTQQAKTTQTNSLAHIHQDSCLYKAYCADKCCSMLSTSCNKNASMSFQLFATFYRWSSRILQNSLIHIHKLTHTSNLCTQVCLFFTPSLNTLLPYLTQVCLLFTLLPDTLHQYLTQIYLRFTSLPNTSLLLFTLLPNKVKFLGSDSKDEDTIEAIDWQWHTVEQH